MPLNFSGIQRVLEMKVKAKQANCGLESKLQKSRLRYILNYFQAPILLSSTSLDFASQHLHWTG